MTAHPVNEELLMDLRAAIDAVGVDETQEALRRLRARSALEALTLTIIANEGVHYLSPDYMRGEVFIASRGPFDLSSHDAMVAGYSDVLSATARKLKERPWRHVYIVPFGPTALSMQMKLLVYRVCGLESIEVVQLDGQKRSDFSLNLKQLIVSSGG